MIAVLCALAGGALFYFSLGLNDMWFLAWLAPAPVLWLAYGEARGWQVALAAFVAFAAGFGFIFQCYQPIMPAYMLAVLILPSILSFVIAVMVGGFAARRLPAFVALFAFPAAFTALEFALASLWPHGSILSVANSQVSAPIVIQSASLLGPWLITFLICLCGNAIALTARGERRTMLAAAAGLALCAANVVYGAARLSEPTGETVRVATFSDVHSLVTAYRAKTDQTALDLATTYARAIREAAAQGATLAVTPEGGILSTHDRGAAILAPLRSAVNDTGIRLIAGIWDNNPAGDLALLFAKGQPLRSYAKRHLFPGLEDQFTPGRTSGVFGGGLATAICKDMDFPRTLRADAALGIRIMAVPANDFVYDGWIHARVAILRGVENGFALVRAANQGVSTISDAMGRVIASKTSAATGMTVVIANVPLGPGPTLYTSIGNVFAWGCLVAAFVLAAAAFAAQRGRRWRKSAANAAPETLT